MMTIQSQVGTVILSVGACRFYGERTGIRNVCGLKVRAFRDAGRLTFPRRHLTDSAGQLLANGVANELKSACKSDISWRSRKPLGVQAPPGFKSLPLRSLFMPFARRSLLAQDGYMTVPCH
jgi:hypothetical protein